MILFFFISDYYDVSIQLKNPQELNIRMEGTRFKTNWWTMVLYSRSILTGLFPPSGGTARIAGLDIHKDMDSIRRETGICPQYNTLFDRLTVEEHMKFYAGLKGKLDSSFEQEFTTMITDLGIPHKRHEFPKNLSGGMKRKLSVACSFIGGSKTVFLDEPTSGVGRFGLIINYNASPN